jgi:hypothetical protein
MRIGLDIMVIFGEDFEKKLVLIMMDGFDDETVIPREVEERAGLSWAT